MEYYAKRICCSLMRTTRKQYPSPLMLKQEFVKQWMKVLQAYTNFNKEMTISERRKAIKLSADVAIASTRIGSTNWSRALMAGLVSKTAGRTGKIAAEKNILGRETMEKNKARLTIACGKRIVRRSCLAWSSSHKKATRVGVCTSIEGGCSTRRLVKNRTRVLKRLVPGGEQMDEVCLIKETLDYIASLQVQVDVMRSLAAFVEDLDPPKT